MKGFNYKTLVFGLITCTQLVPSAWALYISGDESCLMGLPVKSTVAVASEVTGVVDGLWKAGNNAFSLGKRAFDFIVPNATSASGTSVVVSGSMVLGGLAGWGISRLPVLNYSGKKGAILGVFAGAATGGSLAYAYLRSQAKLASLESKVDQVIARVDNVSDQIKNVSDQVKGVQDAVARVTQQIEDKALELKKAITSAIDSLKIDEIKKELVSLQVEQQNLIAQIASLNLLLPGKLDEILSYVRKNKE